MTITKKEIKRFASLAFLAVGVGMIKTPISNFLKGIFPFSELFIGTGILLIGALLWNFD